jgi:hypothetical protein
VLSDDASVLYVYVGVLSAGGTCIDGKGLKLDTPAAKICSKEKYKEE